MVGNWNDIPPAPGKASGEWVRIADKLPAEMDMVLIATLDGVTFGCLVDDAGYRIWSWDGYNELSIDFSSVTHWMPFPPGPVKA